MCVFAFYVFYQRNIGVYKPYTAYIDNRNNLGNDSRKDNNNNRLLRDTHYRIYRVTREVYAALYLPKMVLLVRVCLGIIQNESLFWREKLEFHSMKNTF